MTGEELRIGESWYLSLEVVSQSKKRVSLIVHSLERIMRGYFGNERGWEELCWLGEKEWVGKERKGETELGRVWRWFKHFYKEQVEVTIEPRSCGLLSHWELEKSRKSQKPNGSQTSYALVLSLKESVVAFCNTKLNTSPWYSAQSGANKINSAIQAAINLHR